MGGQGGKSCAQGHAASELKTTVQVSSAHLHSTSLPCKEACVLFLMHLPLISLRISFFVLLNARVEISENNGLTLLLFEQSCAWKKTRGTESSLSHDVEVGLKACRL